MAHKGKPTRGGRAKTNKATKSKRKGVEIKITVKPVKRKAKAKK